MIYFIFSAIILIFLLLFYVNRKLKKIKIKMEDEKKFTDDAVMRDLRELRKLLNKVDDPEARIEIIKKIEIITSMYN